MFGNPPSEITVGGVNIDTIAETLTVYGTTNIANKYALTLKLYDDQGDEFDPAWTAPGITSGQFTIKCATPFSGTYVAKVYYQSDSDPAGDVSGPFTVP